MFKKVAPYMGEYKKYTFRAVMMMCYWNCGKNNALFFSVSDCFTFDKGAIDQFGICDAEGIRDTFI